MKITNLPLYWVFGLRPSPVTLLIIFVVIAFVLSIT